MGVLDLDGIDPADLKICLDHLTSSNYAFIFYTTWSHDASNGHYRARIITPLAQPIEAKTWGVAWPGYLGRVFPDQSLLNKLWDRSVEYTDSAGKRKHKSVLDHMVSNVAGIYFGPYVPPGTPLDTCICIHQPGEPIPIDFETVGAGLAISAQQTFTQVRIPRDVLHMLATSLGRSSKSETLELGWRLSQIVKGEPFAESGERDNAIWRLSELLAERLPYADPTALANHFAPSLQMMSLEDTDCPTIETVKYKLERAQVSAREKRAKQQKLDQDAIVTRRANGWRLMGVFDRKDTYTEQELEGFADQEGCTVPELNSRMLVRQQNSIHIFGNGQYLGPFVANHDAPLAVDQLLAPAEHIQLYRTTSQGFIVPRSLDYLTRKYGTISRHTRIDMTAQRTYYDADTSEMVEAPYPLRADLQPTYNEQVDLWLNYLVGSKIDLLKGWLADIPNLQHPCAAVFLYGAAGSGKSFLATGISRLYNTRGPASLHEAMQPFNDELLKNPILVADESLPVNFQGVVRTQELRLLIQAFSQPLKRKFLPPATLIGSPRILLAANNESMLVQAGELAAADIVAISERFLLIRVSENATRYLQSVKHNHWIEDDTIAQHVLWLHHNHHWVPEGRFRHRDTSSFLSEILGVRSGVRFAVCMFLIRYLQNPRVLDTQLQGMGILIRHGRLFVKPTIISEHWQKYVPLERIPEASKIAAAVRGLSKRKSNITIGGVVQRYQQISTKLLVAWANDNDAMTADEITQALKRPTPLRETT